MRRKCAALQGSPIVCEPLVTVAVKEEPNLVSLSQQVQSHTLSKVSIVQLRDPHDTILKQAMLELTVEHLSTRRRRPIINHGFIGRGASEATA